MDRVNPRCAGLDVHKDSVWACARADGGKPFVEKFGTTSRELLRLGDWLAGHGVTVVAMESWRWSPPAFSGSRCGTCWRTASR